MWTLLANFLVALKGKRKYCTEENVPVRGTESLTGSRDSDDLLLLIEDAGEALALPLEHCMMDISHARHSYLFKSTSDESTCHSPGPAKRATRWAADKLRRLPVVLPEMEHDHCLPLLHETTPR
jgi:hypothetical protein